jgi:hypothetical protein
MSLVHQGILPEFRTTKAMQKSTAKKHLIMTGENFGEAINCTKRFVLNFLSFLFFVDGLWNQMLQGGLFILN